jgi:hypothetical protein
MVPFGSLIAVSIIWGESPLLTAVELKFSECHIEVNNASNKLTGIPFETASSERAEIVVSGGEIIGFSAPLPAAAPTIFRCGAKQD